MRACVRVHAYVYVCVHARVCVRVHACMCMHVCDCVAKWLKHLTVNQKITCRFKSHQLP